MMPPLPSRTSQGRTPVLCFAGFMGSGKSTVGFLLAKQLAWRFVDLDTRIEEAAGLAIPAFFERFGEPAFRQLEAAELRAVLGRAAEMEESTVVALGGGTYAQPGAPEFLRSAGVPVIWLDSPIEVLLSRCMTMTGRPLFRDEASFRSLYSQRVASYQLADYRVDASGEPAVVVGEILRRGIVAAGSDEAHLVVDKPEP
ncbi:MAG TPA: shikimate kinase [Candidatus Dormibacteraeota bacterium]|nr:shikimate kinase [Candidatus Dormibacteraeota bacterium]